MHNIFLPVLILVPTTFSVKVSDPTVYNYQFENGWNIKVWIALDFNILYVVWGSTLCKNCQIASPFLGVSGKWASPSLSSGPV